MSRKKYFEIAIWILIFELMGFLLGIITKSNIVSWYQLLNKSILTPPGFVFSIVWAILYAMLALVGFTLWNNRNRLKIALYFYITQIIMNLAWTPMFFYYHYIFLSFLWIIMMIGLTLVVMVLIKDKLKSTNTLLIPYVLWLGFAAYLNGTIWILN